MRKLIMGNWKMNGLGSDLHGVAEIAQAAAQYASVDAGLCLPATILPAAASANSASGFIIGGQDCHEQPSGAHTGCISAAMLRDAGAQAVIVGHSERRADQHESDIIINGKARAAIDAGLLTIICVGETEQQRDSGQAEDIVLAQIDGSVPTGIDTDKIAVAYEPVWAIGTGRVPSADEVAAMHAAIRARLKKSLGEGGSNVRILYGGSMNGGNADELLAIANVDGGLIGGASLSAEKLEPILKAAANS